MVLYIRDIYVENNKYIKTLENANEFSFQLFKLCI